MRKWFFLTPGWISWGVMITGFLVGGYGFANVLRYIHSGQIRPLYGTVPMPFSSAALFVLVGLAHFWTGYVIRSLHALSPAARHRAHKSFSTEQVVQILLALISAGAVVMVAVVGVLKR